MFDSSVPPAVVPNLKTYPILFEKSSDGTSQENLIFPFPKSSALRPVTFGGAALSLFLISV